MLSLRTWHIMISNLQHPRNEHRSARCGWFQTCFGSAASAFEIIELAYISYALRIFVVTLTKKGFACASLICRELPLAVCARSQLISIARFTRRTQAWGEPRENPNHDWSKKWFQQNSRYAVKLITKGGFITASRSQALGLQRQLQIKF